MIHGGNFQSVTVTLNTDTGGSRVMITLYWPDGSDTAYLSDNQHIDLSDIRGRYTCYYDNQSGYDSKPLEVLYASKKLQLWSRDGQNYIKFEMTGQFEATGNVQSLLNYSDECTPYCFYDLFQSCYYLTKAPELPATKLADRCYQNMFQNCTSLTTAPESLPATTLANYCYNGMFRGCSSLTTAPELPATTLANYCYYNMFYYCSSLTTAPELLATTLANYCYYNMFGWCSNLNYIKVGFTTWHANATTSWLYRVSSTGTFIKPEALADTRGISNIPNGWTVENY